MPKQRRKTYPMKSNRILLIIVVIALVAVVAIGIFSLTNTAQPPATPAAVASVAEAAVVSGLISPQNYTSQFVDGNAAHQLIDVRTPEEFASGHLPNAVNIPLDQLSGRLSEVSTEEPVVLYCRSGNRSNQAANLLAAEGFTQVLDLGGIVAWEAAGLPVVQ